MSRTILHQDSLPSSSEHVDSTSLLASKESPFSAAIGASILADVNGNPQALALRHAAAVLSMSAGAGPRASAAPDARVHPLKDDDKIEGADALVQPLTDGDDIEDADEDEIEDADDEDSDGLTEADKAFTEKQLYRELNLIKVEPAHGLSLLRTPNATRMSVVLGEDVFNLAWSSANYHAEKGLEPTGDLTDLVILLRRHAADYVTLEELQEIHRKAIEGGAQGITAAIQGCISDHEAERVWNEAREKAQLPELGEVEHTARRRVEAYLREGVFIRQSDDLLNTAVANSLFLPVTQGGVSDDVFDITMALLQVQAPGSLHALQLSASSQTGVDEDRVKHFYETISVEEEEGEGEGEEDEEEEASLDKDILRKVSPRIDHALTSPVAQESEGGILADDEGVDSGKEKEKEERGDEETEVEDKSASVSATSPTGGRRPTTLTTTASASPLPSAPSTGGKGTGKRARPTTPPTPTPTPPDRRTKHPSPRKEPVEPLPTSTTGASTKGHFSHCTIT